MRRIGGSESYFPSCNVQTKGWQHDENKYIHLWHISSNTPNAYQEHSWRCTLTWVRRSLHEIPSKTIVCCPLIILKNYVHNLHIIEFSDSLIWHDTHKALLKTIKKKSLTVQFRSMIWYSLIYIRQIFIQLDVTKEWFYIVPLPNLIQMRYQCSCPHSETIINSELAKKKKHNY